MKRKLWTGLVIALLSALLCCGLAAADSSGSCGENVTYTLTDAGVLTISGTGPMTDFTNANPSPFWNVSAITSVVIKEGVTSVGQYAFYNCSEIASVSLPSTVTSIGNNAFYQCYKLASIDLPEALTNLGSYAFFTNAP